MSDAPQPVPEGPQTLPPPIPVNEQEELVLKLYDHYEQFKNDISPLHENIKRWHKIYETEAPTDEKEFPWKGAANYTVPLAMATVDSIHARIAKSVFDVDPIWLAKGRVPGSGAKAKLAEKYLDYWADEMQLPSRLDMVIHLMLVEGVGVARVDWDRRQREIPRNAQQQMQMGAPQPKVTEYEGPAARPVSLLDYVMIPADAPSMDDAVYVGHRVFRTQQQLLDRQRGGIYFNVDELLERSQGDETLERSPHAEKILATSNAGQEQEETRQYEVVEMYGPYDWGDGPTPTLFAFSPQHKVLLRIEPYPYEYGRAPYVDWCVYPRPNSFWGRSMVGMLESPQEELTTLHNQRADAISRRIAPPLLRRIGSRWNPEKQPWRPGMVIDVNDPAEIVELALSDIPQGIFAHEQDILSFVERMTGMSDVFMGRMGSPYATATAVNRVTSEGLARMDINVSRFQGSMKKLAWILWWLLYQYRPAIDRFVVGDQTVEISKLDMAPQQDGLMPFEFIPQGALSDASKEARRQQLTFLLQASTGPLSQFYPDGIQWLLRELFDAYDIADRDKAIGPSWNLIQQQLQAAFQQGMQQGMQQAAQAAEQEG